MLERWGCCHIHMGVFIDDKCRVGCPSMGCSQHRRDNHGVRRTEASGKSVGSLQAFGYSTVGSGSTDGLGYTFWKTDRVPSSIGILFPENKPKMEHEVRLVYTFHSDVSQHPSTSKNCTSLLSF